MIIVACMVFVEATCSLLVEICSMIDDPLKGLVTR